MVNFLAKCEKLLNGNVPLLTFLLTVKIVRSTEYYYWLCENLIALSEQNRRKSSL